jgi:hypothetical protein
MGYNCLLLERLDLQLQSPLVRRVRLLVHQSLQPVLSQIQQALSLVLCLALVQYRQSWRLVFYC